MIWMRGISVVSGSRRESLDGEALWAFRSTRSWLDDRLERRSIVLSRTSVTGFHALRRKSRERVYASD